MLNFFKSLKKCAYLGVSTFFISTGLLAEPDDIDDTKIQQLAQLETWQRLIFLHRGWPEIKTADFYLSNVDEAAPEKELAETLAYFKRDDLAKCKFPARYYWLSTQLDLPYLKQGLDTCKYLPKPMNKMSVLLIGGYLKNPASTFGHMLVRIDDMTNDHYLLSNTYNFGGQIPENERGLVYAINGVLGKYPAVFVHSDYYRNEALYSRLENRDIWEYQLNLTEQEKTLLTYHLDELTRFKFNYYFIKQNCAYRTAELFEFIDGVRLTKRLTPWYSPEYVVNELIDFDEKNERQLIEHEVFRASEQTQLQEYFKTLPDTLRQQVNHVLRTKNIESLNTFSAEQQDTMFYFLMKYAEMKHKESPEEQEYSDFRKALLRKRITRPAVIHSIEPKPIDKISPASGPKPSKTGIRVGNQVGIDFTLYQRDPLNEGTDLNMNFEVLAAKYHHYEAKDYFAVDILNITKLADLAYPLYGQKKLSWQLRTGIQTDMFEQHSKQHFAQMSFGAAHSWTERWMGYQLLGLSVHDQDSHADVKSISGLLYKSNIYSGKLEYENIVRQHDHVENVALTVKRKIEKNTDIRLHLDKQSGLNAQAAIGLNYYW